MCCQNLNLSFWFTKNLFLRMEEYSEIFRDVIKSANTLRNSKNDLLSTLALLTQELEYQREYSKNIETQMNSLLGDQAGESSLTALHLDLKENNEKLTLEIERLKSEKIELNIELVSETEQMRVAHEEDRIRILESHQNELKTIQNELDKVKRDSKLKEDSLFNEIQLVQASSALSLDEVQSNLKQQLRDTSNQLSQSLKSGNNLRTELRLLREEYSSYKDATNQKIAELKRRCEYSEENSHNSNPPPSINNSYMNESRSTARFTYKNRESTVKKSHNWSSSKYRPLNVNPSNSRCSSEEFIPGDSPRVTRFDNSDNQYTTNNSPPNQRFSRNNSSGGPTKKRKLYTPDDYGYCRENQNN